jgi:hypothetical protein
MRPRNDLFAVGSVIVSSRVLSRLGWVGFAIAFGVFLFDPGFHEGAPAVCAMAVMGWCLTLASVPTYRNWLDVSVKERGLGLLWTYVGK